MSLIHKDLVQASRLHTAHDVLHRETLLARIIRVIGRASRNNLLILGEPGVGKTALLEALAFRLAHHGLRLPHTERVIQLNTSRLAMLLAERDALTLEREREELLAMSRTLIVLDDARLFLSQNDLTSLLFFLQPLLERRDLSVAILCGMAEYRRYLEKDPVCSREMEPVQVGELTLEESQEVVLALSAVRMQEVGCEMDGATASQATALAKRYIPDRALPDKAMNLINEGLAKVASEGRHKLTLADIRQVIADKTGIPMDSLTASEQEKLLNLEKELDGQVIGQPHVTAAVSRVIRRSRAGLKDSARPIASFLFLGSSGVGKTELAKVLARTVYHNERAMLRFDMSEFSESHTVQRLVGAPPGYIGFEDGGQLTNAVLAQPYSLILLDEIEKAHPKVFDMFLQVMDDGRLTDGKGRTVDFSNTIIIATSNIALDEVLAGFAAGQDVSQRDWYEKTILPMLTVYFRPEFINRFDDVLVFSPFSLESLQTIARLEVEKLRRRLAEQDIEVEVDQVELARTVERLYNPVFGARPIRRHLQDTIENELADKILAGNSAS